MNFRKLVKTLHPDTNGGDTSRVTEFIELIKAHKKLCACGCGRHIPNYRTRYHGQMCFVRHRYYRHALAAAACLLLAFSGCKTADKTLPPMLPKLPTPAKVPFKVTGDSVRAAALLPPKVLFLNWDYPLPLPRDSVMFDIESRSDFNSPWQRIGFTNRPPYQINTTTPKAFYRVGSHKP